ncbi:MAG: hypothetical protein ACJAW2_001557 [Shewanella sp.]|jgi:hypothetical protein
MSVKQKLYQTIANVFVAQLTHTYFRTAWARFIEYTGYHANIKLMLQTVGYIHQIQKQKSHSIKSGSS